MVNYLSHNKDKLCKKVKVLARYCGKSRWCKNKSDQNKFGHQKLYIKLQL